MFNMSLTISQLRVVSSDSATLHGGQNLLEAPTVAVTVATLQLQSPGSANNIQQNAACPISTSVVRL